MTGYATVPAAVQAMRSGAYDYLSKPFNLEELRLTLERAASHFNLTTENRVLRTKLRSKEGFGNMIGRSPQMEKLYRFISKAANSQNRVLTVCRLRDEPVELLHLRGTANHVPEAFLRTQLGPQDPVFCREIEMTSCPFQGKPQFFQVERLRKVVIGAGAHSLYCCWDRRIPGHNDNDDIGIAAADILEHLLPAGAAR